MKEKLRFSKKGWFLAILFVLLLPVGGYYGFRAWAYYSTYVTTDNAYVEGDVAQITPRIPGTVAEVLVKENWWVKPGQALVRLDPQDYEVRLAVLKAALQKARETVDQLFSEVRAAEARVALAGVEFRQAQLDFQRARQLFEEEVIPVQQFDLAKTRHDAAASRLSAAQRELERVKSALGGNLTTPRYQRSIVQEAEATMREAELNLSYCTLTSPIEGMVSRKAVEVGQRVQPGQPLMAIVPLHRVYIEANYKETQLTDVRVGQPAEIRADIYPRYVYRGKVDSLSAGTGAAFSLLPPENATGNWVKVVQRVPVKITLDEPPPADRPLRVGLSVEVTIDTSNHQGFLLSSLLQQEAKKKASLSTMGTLRSVSLSSLPPNFQNGEPSSP